MATPLKCVLFATFLGALLVGCAPSRSVGNVAQEKPLSSEEAKLLEQINAVTPTDRKNFLMKHSEEIIELSKHNKTFGDRMNAALGVSPQANP